MAGVGPESMRAMELRQECDQLRLRCEALEAEREGLRRFLVGEQVSVSTDISGAISYGYGELDNNGFWQYPISPTLAATFRELRALREEHEAVWQAMSMLQTIGDAGRRLAKSHAAVEAARPKPAA